MVGRKREKKAAHQEILTAGRTNHFEAQNVALESFGNLYIFTVRRFFLISNRKQESCTTNCLVQKMYNLKTIHNNMYCRSVMFN